MSVLINYVCDHCQVTVTNQKFDMKDCDKLCML